MKCSGAAWRNIVKLTVVFVCLVGFVIQTWEFLEFYWTYPTIVDIQETVVSETDLPGISFCNTNAVNPMTYCKAEAMCYQYFILKYLKFCSRVPELCGYTEDIPENYTIVSYHTFLIENNVTPEFLEELKKKPETYLTCKIIRGSKEFDCEMDDIITASYYSDTTPFNLCYTLNSLWGNPKKKIQKIGKYDKIVLDFFVDMSTRGRAEDPEAIQEPLFNLLSGNPSIQLGVHSPYITTSAYVSGLGFLGGKHYKVHLSVKERHLLPPPYQTNCTDYMSTWTARGGYGPLNELMVVEECKYNKSIERLGCIPYAVDYPHNQTICSYCSGCDEIAEITEECSELLDLYNQPCDFVTYDMLVEEKVVLIKKSLQNPVTGEKENIILHRKEHNCSGDNIWTQKCNELRIEIVFDNFVVSNLTYNPKIESLELFSVIGGYMGIYLGFSIVTVYDLAEWFLVHLFGVLKNKQVDMKKKRIRKNKVLFAARSEISRPLRRRNIR